MVSSKSFKLEPVGTDRPLQSRYHLTRQVMITGGPYAGLKAIVLAPAAKFPFEKLPAELRQIIYDLVLNSHGATRIKTRNEHRGVRLLRCSFDTSSPTFVKPLSLLCVSRAVSNEAKEFLYKPDFVFTTMSDLIWFLERIGKAKRHLISVTVERSGHNLTGQCCRLLSEAVKLRHFMVTFPSTFQGTMLQHMRKHWDHIQIFCLANHADLTASIERSKVVDYRVGPGQTSLVDRNGAPVRSITPAMNTWCKRYTRRELENHFYQA